MSIKGIDHVVIRVLDLDQAVASYRKILGVEPKLQSSDALKADMAFFYLDNGTFIELIMPTDDASPIAQPLEKRGEGIHSIVFSVDDREKTMADLESKEVRVMGGSFVHPRSANGVLLQLTENQT